MSQGLAGEHEADCGKTGPATVQFGVTLGEAAMMVPPGIAEPCAPVGITLRPVVVPLFTQF